MPNHSLDGTNKRPRTNANLRGTISIINLLVTALSALCAAVTIFATLTRLVHSTYLAEGILASNNVERSRLPLGV